MFKQNVKLIVFTLIALAITASAAFAADGFGSSATGGAGGTPVTVTTAAQLIQYAQNSGTTPYIITVSGTITITGGVGTSGGAVAVKSNKTIQGADTNAKIIGTLDLGAGGTNNVIIQNLNITNPNNIGRGDGITCYGATNIFITHCTFFDCADGCCDINNGSDFVTVSWCKFYYTGIQDHRYTMISGNTTEPYTDRQHITLHHNWWAQNCDQRMPSGSYCTVHMYNNYFSCTGNSYCSNGRAGSQMLSENNYYNAVKSPIYDELGGIMHIVGNIYVNCTGNAPDAGTDTVFTPTYGYSLDNTADVPTIVMASAGNISGGASDTTPPTPNPMTWLTVPYAVSSSSISMVATTATDTSGVEYYFANITAPTHDSGWQDSSSYTDTGLTPSTTYTYSVIARDKSPNLNETGWSTDAAATTPAAPVTYYPGSYTVSRGTYSSGTVASLTANDNSYLVIASTTSGTRYATTDFTVTGIAGTPSRLDLQVITKSSQSSTSQKVYLYNYATAVWDQADSTTIGTSEVTRNIAAITDAANYVSGGQLKIRTDGSKSNKNFNLSHELISVKVTQ